MHYLINQKISFKAKGILAVMLSTPDKNRLPFKHELVHCSTDGYDSMNTGFKELIDAGYITTVRMPEIGVGAVVKFEYMASDFPRFLNRISKINKKK